jgi:7-cyano-7-deazaguanine synthase
MLMGGGIDSTLVSILLLDKLSPRNLYGLHIDYGHAASINEYAAVHRFCTQYGVECAEIKIQFPHETDTQEVPGRNMIMLLAASSIADRKGYDAISVGFHSQTECYDQSENFMNHARSIILGYFSGRVSVYHPLIALNKKEIIMVAKDRNFDFDSVYSCQNGTTPPCGKCPSCLDRILI